MNTQSYDSKKGFLYINNLCIDSTTFRKWDTPPNNNNLIYATKTLDSVHDELGKEAKKARPNDWEDKMIEFTSVETITPPLLIKDILTTYGKCIVAEDSNSKDEGKVPYVIPNNNENCYVKDCFPGGTVPGLNNLLDQSIASLKSFFVNTKTENLLKNPLNGNGGLGQQLMAKNNGDNRLQYTAYFNYDLLIFRYILDTISFTKNNKKTTQSKLLDNLLNKIVNTPNILLTNREIQLINTVNINLLWAYLMIFCKESVELDEYLKKNQKVSEYLNMLLKLSQIRFDGFMINKTDGYISNPMFYYRGTSAFYILDKDSANYVDYVCKTVYDNMKGGNLFPITLTENRLMAGGVQYVTSQSIAATCITTLMGKMRSVMCRNADNKDPDKNACMNELNRLMNNKKQAPSGWSILKYSGDSSHIVYGEILEWVKNYYNMDFQITYLLSERPLAGRLLTAGKDIIILATNVFMKNFSGNGSENKDERRSALYITFDKSISYVNIIEGFYKKIVNVLNNEKTFVYVYEFTIIKTTNFQQPIDNATFPQMVSFLQPLLGSNIESNPTASNINDAKIAELSSIIQSKNIKNILEAYDVDDMIENIVKIPTEFNELAFNLIGRRLGNIRWGSKSNWNFLINELYKRELDATYSNPVIIQFDNIKRLLSMTSLLTNNISKFKGLDVEINTFYKSLLENQGFNAIFSKIIKSYSNNIDKYNRFEEERIAEWLNSKKGESDKIPNGVQLTIQEIMEFIDNCINVNNKLKDAKVMSGGVNEKRKRDDMEDTEDTKDTTKMDVVENNDTSLPVSSATSTTNTSVIPEQATKKQKTINISADDKSEIINLLTEEFTNTLSSFPVNYNEDTNNFDLTELNEYLNELLAEINEIDEEIPGFSNTISFDKSLYNVIVGHLIKLSGIIYENDNKNTKTIQNTINYYATSYKNIINKSFNIDNTNLLNNLYDTINNDINVNINIIKSVNLIELANFLRSNSLGQVKKNNFVNSVNNEFPFIFISMTEDEKTPANMYNYLVNILEEITTISVLQQPTSENVIDNIYQCISFRQNYNQIMSRYKMLIQPYSSQSSGEVRRSERISVFSRIVGMATNLLGRVKQGGKKTRKNKQKNKKIKTKKLKLKINK